MKKLIAGFVFGALLLASGVALSRGVPQFRPLPLYGPLLSLSTRPQYAGKVGPHGLPMLRGSNGRREEAHNDSILRSVLPGALFGEAFARQKSVDIESFIDAIDVRAPLEAVHGCMVDVCRWGAMYIASSGATGTDWDEARLVDAQRVAHQMCDAYAGGVPCTADTWMSGSAWGVGLYCERDGVKPDGLIGLGNYFGAALDNAYRFAAQQLGFGEIKDCVVMNAVAADGSHMKYLR